MNEKPRLSEMFLTYFKRVDDPLALILKIHLFTEYWINRLIESKSPTAQEILDDQRSYGFSVKLNVVFNMGLIPVELYGNIKKLNKLRNNFAHNLEYNFLDSDFDYFDPEKRFNLVKYKRVLSDPDLTSQMGVSNKDAILAIGVLTFGWLNNHCIQAHKLSGLLVKTTTDTEEARRLGFV